MKFVTFVTIADSIGSSSGLACRQDIKLSVKLVSTIVRLPKHCGLLDAEPMGLAISRARKKTISHANRRQGDGPEDGLRSMSAHRRPN
jgi:hypothetical protein